MTQSNTIESIFIFLSSLFTDMSSAEARALTLLLGTIRLHGIQELDQQEFRVN